MRSLMGGGTHRSINRSCHVPQRGACHNVFLTSPHSAKASRIVSSSMFQERFPMNTDVQPWGFSLGWRCCWLLLLRGLADGSYLRTRTQRPESPRVCGWMVEVE